MKKWDIVILRYPFTDLTSSKARPALVVSPKPQTGGDDIVVIAITGNTACRGPHDVLFTKTDPEFIASGLVCDSVIKVDKIFTLHKSLARNTLGRLGVSMQERVRAKLIQFFELS